MFILIARILLTVSKLGACCNSEKIFPHGMRIIRLTKRRNADCLFEGPFVKLSFVV